MKSSHVIRTNRPLKGLVAFMRAAAMKAIGGCASTLHLGIPASYQWLDRNEDQVHPGEGSA